MYTKRPNAKENKYPEVLKKLKENIRTIRREKGCKSAEKFAERLDVSLKTVQSWEKLNSDRWPDLAMMVHLCETMDCDFDYLLGRMKEHTHGNKYIYDHVGLSEKAINKLDHPSTLDDGVSVIKVPSVAAYGLNQLVESDGFDSFINAFNVFLVAAEQLGKAEITGRTRTVIQPGEVTLGIDDLTRFYMKKVEEAIHDLCMPVFNKNYNQGLENARKVIEKTDDRGA